MQVLIKQSHCYGNNSIMPVATVRPDHLLLRKRGRPCPCRSRQYRGVHLLPPPSPVVMVTSVMVTSVMVTNCYGYRLSRLLMMQYRYTSMNIIILNFNNLFI